MTPMRLFHLIRSPLMATMLALSLAHAHEACQFNTIGAVAFGAYDVFSLVATMGTGSIRISSCSGAPFVAMLSTGNGGSYAPRTMLNGVNTLQYNLYKDANRTVIWGDGSGGTATASSNGSTTFTVYGQIPAGQDAAAGVYADSIVATITF
ncbi:MAG: SCPU domain-containing protein [Rhodocyclaceae bacterium]|nr:MAG: SCPU domain-containing protein [Rhodocyclaceae bacterium]